MTTSHDSQLTRLPTRAAVYTYIVDSMFTESRPSPVGSLVVVTGSSCQEQLVDSGVVDTSTKDTGYLPMYLAMYSVPVHTYLVFRTNCKVACRYVRYLLPIEMT